MHLAVALPLVAVLVVGLLLFWIAGRLGKSVFVNVGSRGYHVGSGLRFRRTRLRDARGLPWVNVVDRR